MDEGAGRMRIDKWLWCARFFKSRSLASQAVEQGPMRIDGRPIHKASAQVGVGMVLTFAQARQIRVVEILALAGARGPASVATTLYRDLAPPPAPGAKAAVPDPGLAAPVAARPAGDGRPTKKDRRKTDALRTGWEE